MIQILSWNIQCGKGVDGEFSLNRIADVSRQFCDADILCFQEVARHDPELDGGRGEDQVDQLGQLFPEHEVYFGAALDRRSCDRKPRRQFGNMILSRLPVIQVFSHLLPRPATESSCPHMPRQALEVVVALPDGPARLVTTHLEFHSEAQRLAQIKRLLEIQHSAEDIADYANYALPTGPYAAVAYPARSIVCGDFNVVPNDRCYRTLLGSNDTSGFHDAWQIATPKKPHDPTCGIFDHKQWPQGEHCRDYFLVTPEFDSLVDAVEVQRKTAASDHQPILISLSL